MLLFDSELRAFKAGAKRNAVVSDWDSLLVVLEFVGSDGASKRVKAWIGTYGRSAIKCIPIAERVKRENVRT